MIDFLDKIIDVLPEYQKIAIKSLIEQKRKQGETPSLRLQQTELNSLYSRIKDNLGKLLLTPRYAISDEKISSVLHNKNMEEIYLDLNALYSNINQLGKLNQSQYITLFSEYEKSKAAVQKLINDVKVFSLKKKYPDFNEVNVIDFNISKNDSKKSPIASINPNVRVLQLKPILYTRAHLIDRGSRNTKVYTKTYARGIKNILSKSFSPESMVDQRPETFWSTLVMSDVPISQTYEKNTSSGEIVKINVDGPVSEIYLQFSHIEQINTIRYLPFAAYPIKVIDVSYKPSPNSQVLLPIGDFNESSTLDWEELNFETVYAHEIRITIAQENSKQVIYHLPKHVAINTDLFTEIFNSKALDILDKNNIPDSDTLLNILNAISSYNTAAQLLEDVLIASGTDVTTQPETVFYDSLNAVMKDILGNIDPNLKDSILNQITERSNIFTEAQTEIIEINKHEYLLGMREVECGYTVYSPVSYYSSEKFNTQATVSEISIEVDERHTQFKTAWENNYQVTSTEWEVDIGDGRKIPIHPRNIVDDIDQLPTVKDEKIVFSVDNTALTRLGGYYASVYRLKKDGNVIPSSDYTVIKVTGAIPRLKLTLTGDWIDRTSIYTVDYAVEPSAYSIQILDKFDSKPLPSPEVFNFTGPDNDIQLSKYPFINYEVVNLDSYFIKNSGNSSWIFNPPQANIGSGQLKIFPTIIDNVGNILYTGNLTGSLITGLWGPSSGEAPINLTTLSNTYFGNINGVNFGYFLKVMDSLDYVEISQFLNSTGILFTDRFVASQEAIQNWDAVQSGVVFRGVLTGANPSGYLNVDYVIGIGIKTDDAVFTLSSSIYNPIVVKIAGKEARNITNYETLQHPSFNISTRKDNEYQYIQAGKRIYFNQPITNQEIKVQYNWITEYISINGTLRCNKLATPDLTPKVNSIRILSNNLVI